MKSRAWYQANSFCLDGDGVRHEGEPITTVGGQCVGHICPHCHERVRRVRTGSPLWVLEDIA